MVPEIDLREGHLPEQRKRLSSILGEAASRYGFLTLVHHGIDEEQIQRGFELARMFFSRDLQYKMQFAKSRFRPQNSNAYRGYFPVLEDDESQKEGFEFGTCRRPHPEFPETLPWPDVPNMREHFTSMHSSLSQLAQRVLALLSIYLGWPEDSFHHDFENGMSTFRLIHYPSQAVPSLREPPSRFDGDKERFSTPDHTDSGFLTLLFQDDCGGLEALSPSGTWVEVPPRPGAIVMNLGDLLSFMSHGKLKATRHRVRAPQKSRLSMPFFFEPQPGMQVPDLRHGNPGATIDYASFLKEKILSFGEYAKAR